jgi:dTDP-4-amino-4,6-dideoxygalactose transaminase
MDVVSTGAPFFRPWIGREEIDAVTTVLLSGAIAGHATSAEFERMFARYVDAAYAVSVNSSAAAVTLALEVAGVRPGDDVITSPYVSPGVAAVIRALRARIVFADVDPHRGGLLPAAVARRVTPATRVIIAPHAAGVPCDLDALMAIGAGCGIVIIEEGSQALGARYRGRMVGSVGHLCVFGFGETCDVAAGAGAIVTTDVAEYADAVRSRADSTDCRMGELSAAFALAQLRKAEQFRSIRAYYAELYQLGLADCPEFVLPVIPADVVPAWHSYRLRLDPERLAADRDTFIARLQAAGVPARAPAVPLHMQMQFLELGYSPADYPEATALHARTVTLPLYARMSEAEVWDVVHAVRAASVAHRGGGCYAV